MQQSFPKKLLEDSEFELGPSRGEKSVSQTPGTDPPKGVQFDDSIAHLVCRPAEKRNNPTWFEVRADHRRIGQRIDDDIFGVRPGNPAASE